MEESNNTSRATRKQPTAVAAAAPGFRGLLAGRLGSAIQSFQRGLAEESFAAVDERRRNAKLHDHHCCDGGDNDATTHAATYPSDQFFVRPSPTIVIQGRRRVLARDDSFIRQPSTMSSFANDGDCSGTVNDRDSKEEKFDTEKFNTSTSTKHQAFTEFATELNEEQSSNKESMTNAVLKARAAERARRRMTMLTKDDSLINRTNINQLEPFHFSLSDGVFRRVGFPTKSDFSSQPVGITTWQRPTLAESWDIANTLNLQTVTSTRNVGEINNYHGSGGSKARNTSNSAA